MDLPWQKRADLRVTRHDGGGWVVKDPVRLEYALLDEVEYSVLQSLDGRTSTAAVVDRLLRQFPGRGLTAEDVANFVRSLAGHQLVRPLVSVAHFESDKQRSSLLTGVLGSVGQILRLQLPLLNPRPLLDRLLPAVRRVVTPVTLAVAAAICLLAAGLALLQFRELAVSLPRLSQFLAAENVVPLLLIFSCVKLLHELAHALTARHFGADCHECGIMLLIFTPVLYTNVTDSWTLPRRQRMWVTAAGMAVELFIAAVCLLLWWQAKDGALRALLLNTVVVCSVSTLLFNGNPLLRFDGYFLLSDALCMPNLSARSMRTLRAFLVAVVTGVPQSCGESRQDRRVLLAYGLAAACYRVLLTCAIIGVIRVMATAWHLEFAGTVVTWALILGSLVLPAAGFVLAVGATAASGERPSAWWRSLLAAAALVAICVLPLPHSVQAPAITEPTGVPIYAPLAGRVRPSVHIGASLQVGDTIATLENPDLLLDQQRYASQSADLRTQLSIIERDPQDETRFVLPALQTALESSERQQATFAAELKTLHFTSPIAGTLLGPPDRLGDRRRGDQHEDRAWQTTALSRHQQGVWLERGTLLGYVSQPWDVQVQVCVAESDISQIVVGQPASIYIAGRATMLRGEVIDVSREPLQSVAEELAAAGVVRGQPEESGVRPIETLYAVTVAVPPSGRPPALYQVAVARIETPPKSLLVRLLQFLRNEF